MYFHLIIVNFLNYAARRELTRGRQQAIIRLLIIHSANFRDQVEYEMRRFI